MYASAAHSWRKVRRTAAQSAAGSAPRCGFSSSTQARSEPPAYHGMTRTPCPSASTKAPSNRTMRGCVLTAARWRASARKARVSEAALTLMHASGVPGAPRRRQRSTALAGVRCSVSTTSKASMLSVDAGAAPTLLTPVETTTAAATAAAAAATNASSA
jgi:hypothetical protein